MVKPITEERKFLARVQALRLVSCMNRSKWRALITKMCSGRVYSPKVRYKEVGSTTIFGPSHFDWEAVRGAYCAYCKHIEWMQLDCHEIPDRGKLATVETIDHKLELFRLLTHLRIPFTDEGRYLVIKGYEDGSETVPRT